MSNFVYSIDILPGFIKSSRSNCIHQYDVLNPKCIKCACSLPVRSFILKHATGIWHLHVATSIKSLTPEHKKTSLICSIISSVNLLTCRLVVF